MLISEEYRKLNGELHERGVGYGTSGHKWAEEIRGFANATQARTILDYGAGSMTLAKAIKDRTVISYDPAVPGIDTPPHPADLVVCGDVLEHIEPDCLEYVLDDLKRLAKRHIFLVVNMRPAKKFLADGRNAHLIQQPTEWWLPKIISRWKLMSFADQGNEFVCVGSAL